MATILTVKTMEQCQDLADHIFPQETVWKLNSINYDNLAGIYIHIYTLHIIGNDICIEESEDEIMTIKDNLNNKLEVISYRLTL